MSTLKLAGEFPALERDDWRALVDASLKGRSFETLRTRTSDGIVIEPVYGPAENPPVLPAAPRARHGGCLDTGAARRHARHRRCQRTDAR